MIINNVKIDDWHRPPGHMPTYIQRCICNSDRIFVNILFSSQSNRYYIGLNPPYTSIFISIYKNNLLPKDISSIEEAQKFIDAFLIKAEKFIIFS